MSSKGQIELDTRDGILTHMSGMAGTYFSTQPLHMTCLGFLTEWQSQGNRTSYVASSFAYREHFKEQDTESARLVKGSSIVSHLLSFPGQSSHRAHLDSRRCRNRLLFLIGVTVQKNMWAGGC